MYAQEAEPLEQRELLAPDDDDDTITFPSVKEMREGNYVGTPKKKKVTFDALPPKRLGLRASLGKLLSARSATIMSWSWLLAATVMGLLSIKGIIEPRTFTRVDCHTRGKERVCEHLYRDDITGDMVDVVYPARTIQEVNVCRINAFNKEVIVPENFRSLSPREQRLAYFTFCFTLTEDQASSPGSPPSESKKTIHATPFSMLKREATKSAEDINEFLRMNTDMVHLFIHSTWKVWAVVCMVLSYISIVFLFFFGKFSTKPKKN